MKFVSNLSVDEMEVLSNLIKDASQHRTRQRAHAIVLSAKSYSIDDLSNIFDVHRDTVSRWIDVWYEKGLDGLFDAPKPGRPKKETADMLM
jgi:transposase